MIRKPHAQPLPPVPAAPGGGRKRRRSTINDIARLADVSKKTVSRVINDSPFVKAETRQKVREIIREVGFTPDPQARGLALRRAFLIATIYDSPDPHEIAALQEGVLDALRGTSFELVIRSVDRAGAGFIDDIRQFVERQKPFGVVLPPPVSEDERLVALLDELDCPHIRILPARRGPQETTVVTQDRAGAAIAARYLAGLGHVRIAHIGGRNAQERRSGFAEGLAASGLELPKKFDRETDGTFEAAHAAAKQLLADKERPTAIVADGVGMALGVYRAAREAGLEIPGDLSVVGFGDSPLASRLTPPLTTIGLPMRSAGRRAAEKLLALRPAGADDRAMPDDVAPALVARESVAKPA